MILITTSFIELQVPFHENLSIITTKTVVEKSGLLFQDRIINSFYQIMGKFKGNEKENKNHDFLSYPPLYLLLK